MQSDSHKGSALSTDDLLKAYTLGYFPMSEGRDDPEVFWVLPEKRGALLIDQFHLPKSLKKAVRTTDLTIRIDHDFAQTMRHCAEETMEREDTWINERIVETYCKLHRMGFAHSVECWDKDEMVGGLYGVSLGGAFFGESMFSRATNASKIALTYLIARMKAGNYSLLDTQFYTEHLGQFGVREIAKFDYQNLLDQALSREASFYSLPMDVDGSTILQSITQTS